MKHILVVEDDNEIRDLICLQLKKENYRIDEAPSGEIALQKIKKEKYDLVILDWMLPGLTGIEITKVLKATLPTPILMVTAKSEPKDIINGLESGADDYVTKPFDLSIFKARVKALLRRSEGGPAKDSSVITIGKLHINNKSHEVTCCGEPVQLTLSEFKLLNALAANNGAVLTRERLIEQIQGEGVSVIDRTVDTHIFGLRKKLGTCEDLIETIRGIGYRICPADD
jgi:two-component system, OmpR family, phosphate regulon response regulator PhoB